MFGMAIWDKLLECIFENFEIATVIQLILMVNHTKPTNTLVWNSYILTAGNYKTVRNYKITLLTVQYQLQSNVWLVY